MSSDIEAMSGTELDHAIAVEVMGWKREDVRESGWPCWESDNPDSDEWWAISAYKPSSDIGLAMQVVEKARERGVYVDVTSEPEYGWFVESRGGTPPHSDAAYFEQGDIDFADVPTAICRCILAALRAKVGKEVEHGK